MSTILVVDDAAFMRRVVCDTLTAGGHEIIGQAENGAAGLSQYKALRPDLMTLDITMPEMDGVETLLEVIRLDTNAKVVMCSALGQESKVLECIKLGAKDFVVKPFQPDALLGAIDKALR